MGKTTELEVCVRTRLWRSSSANESMFNIIIIFDQSNPISVVHSVYHTNHYRQNVLIIKKTDAVMPVFPVCLSSIRAKEGEPHKVSRMSRCSHIAIKTSTRES